VPPIAGPGEGRVLVSVMVARRYRSQAPVRGYGIVRHDR
jgi:hypothetical protein